MEKCPDALDADFQRVYGVPLLDERGDLALSPSRAARWAVHLPRGSQTWVMLGGPNAISGETEALWGIEYAIVAVAHAQGGGKGKKPEPRQYPDGVLAERSRAAKKADHAASKAAEFRARRMAR